MTLVLEAEAVHIRCHRCNNVLGILTPHVFRTTAGKRGVWIYPGASLTVVCECGEKRDMKVVVLDKGDGT